MITDIPTAEEYENSAIECLVQAYNNIAQVDSSLNNETPRDDIWKYNQIVLRTAIVLIHQGLEGLMKSEICYESTLLLIDKKKADWKTLPDSANESFSEMFTIGGDDLLRTYYACVSSEDLHPNFLLLFNEIRSKRNKIVHGLGEEDLTPEYVLKLVLNSFTYLLGKDAFWDAVLDKFYRHPGFNYNDSDVEWVENNQYNRMEYMNMFLGIGELKNHFKIDITARPYFCPACIQMAEVSTDEGLKRPESKWAFLNPNEPTGNKISCIVCQEDFEVLREDCKKDGCKGNVIYKEDEDEESHVRICLTCWDEEDVSTKS
ncbi:MAG: hypothetical protein IM600_18340 [Bacteroidetes bacterium]|nr:hypothetical protein [Bacteroidota bacterium]MCA6445392.1 hypothetical protein [Bacteroidota bacterium]